jgi:hypothetical protein
VSTGRNVELDQLWLSDRPVDARVTSSASVQEVWIEKSVGTTLPHDQQFILIPTSRSVTTDTSAMVFLGEEIAEVEVEVEHSATAVADASDDEDEDMPGTYPIFLRLPVARCARKFRIFPYQRFDLDETAR